MSTILAMPAGETRSPWREKIWTTTPSSGERTSASSRLRLALSTARLGVGEVDLVLRQVVLQRRLRELQPDLLALEALLGEAGFELLLVGRLARPRALQGVELVLLDRRLQGGLLQGDLGDAGCPSAPFMELLELGQVGLGHAQRDVGAGDSWTVRR